jgi:hypothetical protein
MHTILHRIEFPDMRPKSRIDELVDVQVLNRVMKEAPDWVVDRDQAEWPDLAKEASRHLANLFLLISGCAAKSEELLDLNWSPCFFGISFNAKGKRTNGVYDLSLTAREGLTLSTYLCQPTLLNRVTDVFWGHLGALTAMPGHARFADNVGPFDRKSDAAASLQSRSTFFCMIRNYVLLAQESPDSIVDLGSIEYSPRLASVDEAIDELAEAFSHLYSMNYEMYRLAYISAHGRSKRHSQPV